MYTVAIPGAVAIPANIRIQDNAPRDASFNPSTSRSTKGCHNSSMRDVGKVEGSCLIR